MRLSYDPSTDSLYIDLNDKTSVDSDEVAPGVVLDLDEEGNVVGIDFQHASKLLDLTKLEATSLPIAG
jgi:uncharacterized protein YuzE